MESNKKHVCPIDRRRFATKAALNQHTQVSHSRLQPRQQPAQSRGGRNASRGRARTVVCRGDTRSRVVSGTDMIGTSVLVDTRTAVGSILASFEVKPEFFVDTRLDAEAKLWARWKPVNMRLQVIPSAGSMTSGSYAVGFTYDPNFVMPSDETSVRIVNSFNPSSTSNVYNPVMFNIPTDTTQKWYLVEGREAADSIHGKIFVVLVSPVGSISADSKISFSFKLHWTFAFEGAVLPSIGGGVAETVYADDGYEGYHTTSTNDWADGKYLSLKHTAGGSLVPFSRARTGVIYRLDDNAKLNYIKSDGSEGSVKFAVLIRDLAARNFAVFASLTEADKYLASGAATDCLPYYGAGKPITPTNPAWTPVGVTKRLNPLEQRISRLEALLEQALSLRSVPPRVMEHSSQSSSEDFCDLGLQPQSSFKI